MSRTKAIRLIAWIFTAITKEVEGAVSYPPSNAVTEVNGIATLSCSATPSGPLVWVLTRDGITSGEIRITTGCIVSPELQNHYRTEQPGGITTCNLIVFDITMEQAGVYHCTDTDTYRALLTVLDSSPITRVNGSTTLTAVEKENVVIECSLRFNGSVSPAPILQPCFYWTNSDGENISSSCNSATSNTAVSQLTVTAARENITPYTCHLYLQLEPPVPDFYANNTPSVDMTANSPVVEVLYPPSMPQIDARSSGFVACEALQLTCQSEAHPPPNYTWLDLTYGDTTNTQGVIAEYGISYICNASNIIRDVIYFNLSMFYETSTSNSTCRFPRSGNMRISGRTCDGDFCWCECSPATILCYVDSYPHSSYEWILPDGSRVEGRTVETTVNGIYICRSYALIDGWYLVEANRNINVSGCDVSFATSTTSDSTENPSQCTNSSAETAAIVLGVLLAIAITVNIICFLLFYRKGVTKQSDSSDPEVTQPTSNSDVPQYQDFVKETLTIGREYEELGHYIRPLHSHPH